MHQETEQKLSNWIAAIPESGHPYDRERSYDLILTCIKNGDRIDSDDLNAQTANKEWNDEFKENFIDEYISIIYSVLEFIEYLEERTDHDIKGSI